MRNTFTSSVFTAALVVTLLGEGAATGAGPGLRPAGSVALPDVKGRIDHFAADPDGRRLYVSALGNDTLEVIDVTASPPKRVSTVSGLRKPAGVAFLPGLDRVAAASGDDGMCRVLDAGTLKLAGVVRDLDDADNVRYDAAASRLYVGYGGGALAVIDPKSATKLSDVKLPAHPESFRLEENGSRIFVNLPDAGGSIAVVDRAKGKVVATWRPKEAGSNFSMWLDEPRRRLLVGCRRPAKLLVLDTDAGRTVAAVDCVADTDDVWYDAPAKRVYVTGGGGEITVIEQTDADHYRPAGAVKTAEGARTSVFVPATRRLYVAAPRRGDRPAEILVYQAE